MNEQVQKAYWNGFTVKCAEMGADPVKLAQSGGWQPTTKDDHRTYKRVNSAVSSHGKPGRKALLGLLAGGAAGAAAGSVVPASSDTSGDRLAAILSLGILGGATGAGAGAVLGERKGRKVDPAALIDKSTGAPFSAEELAAYKRVRDNLDAGNSLMFGPAGYAMTKAMG